ncbi:MAG: TIGR04290 family methyltransferase [Gammaproteobacteria bacterium]|nr:TIGR04290 family methyltransferase [Gammaproteobacteria bacterium]MBA3732160.1 TIGR04290 family methyltransferase [Gammaproteobacteria bacterium]
MKEATLQSTGDPWAEILERAPWFHNLHLPDGTQTAPEHPLGDFPAFKWAAIAAHIPVDLHGWRVLDVGCNAGFYSIELARRGAHVTAVDIDPHYLDQARWAARRCRVQDAITFWQQPVYALAHDPASYDLVWFMGVFYHLRYPTLALDILRRKTRKLMMFQSLTMPGDHVLTPPENLPIDARERMLEPGWPRMAFIELRLADDPTNWWAPNHACVEAMLRASGFRVRARPDHECYLCEPDGVTPIRHDEELRAAVNLTSK